MSRVLPLALVMLAFLSTEVMAQWESVGQFPEDDTLTATMHGVAVDGDGKVWLSPWSATEELEVSEDSVLTTRAIYVYNPDGSEVDFSPIQIITIDGEPDTLLSPSNGLEKDMDGNILHATGAGWIYRIDSQTGEGIDKFQPQATSATKPAVDDAGNIYTGNVLSQTGPLRIYDNEWNFIENAVDTTLGFSRAFAVTGDGNTIYWGGFTNEAIWKYTRPDEFSPFNAIPDTLFRGMTAEAFTRHPVSGNIWMSAGPSGQGSAYNEFSDYTWYEVDPETDMIVDSLVWDTTAGIDLEKPRGIAFSPDGMTAYAVMFDATSGAPSVQTFQYQDPVAIEKEPGDLPRSFALEQNYPNPFNPSTEIGFDLNEAGHVSLKVFDVLGREVAVLVDEHLTNGAYRFTFDAAHLTSGTYVYVLSANGERQSASMVLAK